MTVSRALLDTSAVIDLGLWEDEELGAASPSISAITVGELALGLDVEDLIERRVRTDRFYAILRELDVLPFDLAAARVYGTLAATLRRAGRSPRPRRMEFQIAAVAGSHDLPLITRNPADFTGLAEFVRIVAV